MAEKADYPAFDHDLHGQVTPETDHGRVYFDGDAGKVICSAHGDKCAIDGSRTLPSHAVKDIIGTTPAGVAIFDHENAPKVGTSRLYRCTVCGQGTWSDGTVVPDPVPAP